MTKEHAHIIGRAVIVIGSIILILWATGYLFTLTYPFIIAAVIAWMLSPLLKYLKIKLKFPSGVASFISLLVGMSLLGGIITGLTFLGIYGFRQLSEQLPGWIEQGAEQLQRIFNETILPIWTEMTGFFDNLTAAQQQTMQEGITQLGNQIGNILGNLGQTIADGLGNIFTAIPTFLLVIIFVFLAVYFIGKDMGAIKVGLQRRIPKFVQAKFVLFIQQMRVRVFGFIRAQLILMFITSVLVLIGLLILGTENPLMMAIIIGVAEILPYLGTGTILIPWAIYSFVTGEIFMGIALSILYIVVVIVRQSLEPKVLSSSMNLNALGVLLSLFIGLQLFGVIGLIIGPALLVIITILNDIGVVAEIEDFIYHGFRKE
ncbi:sporulation integral membrane protein YtvI [Natribacillus halophilus]|uniref:Sporulation integral membrane protein YtvI n=1 Tax=Natribacillus halophilus TaxID=549003 RepID=A0A1G8R2U6_9BACI|nr:sporulation integral membrane protein YtvI [Natribacillus halophilus]SDJ11278.1 sporulation integral membrane protein YtvI [Natribacillus halophilus]